MTVREPIDLLHDYPADLRVVVNGYEDGYDYVRPELIFTRTIRLYSGRNSWEGTHADLEYIRTDSRLGNEIEKALVLQRTSH